MQRWRTFERLRRQHDSRVSAVLVGMSTNHFQHVASCTRARALLIA